MATTPQPTALPVLCTASGIKYFVPAMSAPEVCARFIRALAAARRAPVSLSSTEPREGLVVELHFQFRGMASAKAMRVRAGREMPLPVYELAISDRQFTASDIDILAGDVARGMMAGTPQKGKS